MSMAAVVIGGGAVSATAFAADAELVGADNPVLQCEGPEAPDGFDCDISVDDVPGTSTRPGRLTPAQVTDNVAGCTSGTQPSVAKQISYARTGSISFGASISLDLYKGVNQIIDKVGPGAGVTVSQSTTFGTGHTYTVPSDYGRVAWGIFTQDTIEADVTITVKVTEPATDIPSIPYEYRGENIRVVTPVVDGATGLPKGTLAKQDRNFTDLAEFRALCGDTATPPDYLR